MSISFGRKSTLSTSCLNLRMTLICKGQNRSQDTIQMPVKLRWTSFTNQWTTTINRHMISLVTLTNKIVITAMLSQVKIPYSTIHINNPPSLLTTMIPEWLKRTKKMLCTSLNMTSITSSWKACVQTQINKLIRWCWPSSLWNSAALLNLPQFRSSLWVRVWNRAVASFKFDFEINWLIIS